jgi:uncharacterized membrane protein
MIAHTILTAFVAVIGLILLNELVTFWSDRTGLGNAVVTTAIVLTLVWFVTGLYQLWK